jgi:endo-1,4-beta-mannosidase
MSTLHKEGVDYSKVRGFNYQPSWGSHGIEIWGKDFNIEICREEIGQGLKYFPHINTLRLWLSFDAFIRYPEEMPERFHSMLELGDEFGIRFIPILFNNWHSMPDFGGISVEMVSYWGQGEHFKKVFSPYLERIVKPHIDDKRILLWDLCNEPFNNAGDNRSKTTIFNWLKKVYAECKSLGVNAPLSVGSVPDMDTIRFLEPVSDLITFHPYFAWNAWIAMKEQLEHLISEAVAYARFMNKPLLATETGWGALDDKKRSQILSDELSALAKRGIGFTVHLLHHSLVADAHRPEYGPITNAGYMAFVEKDGTLRPYHDVFNNF